MKVNVNPINKDENKNEIQINNVSDNTIQDIYLNNNKI